LVQDKSKENSVKNIDKKELKAKRQGKKNPFVDVKPKADVSLRDNGIISPTTGVTESKVNALFEKRFQKKAKPCGQITAMENRSLFNKAEKSGIPFDTIKEVYSRGIASWDSSMTDKTPQQIAFDRVNSFISGGKSFKIDDADLGGC
jgi:hypothetical protein